jgi:hypothetical protein
MPFEAASTRDAVTQSHGLVFMGPTTTERNAECFSERERKG